MAESSKLSPEDIAKNLRGSQKLTTVNLLDKLVGKKGIFNLRNPYVHTVIAGAIQLEKDFGVAKLAAFDEGILNTMEDNQVAKNAERAKLIAETAKFTGQREHEKEMAGLPVGGGRR